MPASIRHLLLLVATATVAGCTTCQEARRTVHQEPGLFNWKTDAQASRELYRSWARQAWYEVGISDAPCTNTAYAWGFREGFAEFVFGGGTGEPPPVPPREFWNVGWRADESGTADDWFAGYRHGASIASEGGYRDRAVVAWSMSSDALSGCMTPLPSEACPCTTIGRAAPEVVFPSRIETALPDTESLPTPQSTDPDLESGKPLPDSHSRSTSEPAPTVPTLGSTRGVEGGESTPIITADTESRTDVRLTASTSGQPSQAVADIPPKAPLIVHRESIRTKVSELAADVCSPSSDDVPIAAPRWPSPANPFRDGSDGWPPSASSTTPSSED